ncbi:hypothetical protein GCK32_000689 [Trichostrongylus colubriformis]|uniref:Uncharacterized protein n=1 Tax=Trichostrongylus colubriformis TaxID=6319 RepID=A0AAN8IXN1_TRICO
MLCGLKAALEATASVEQGFENYFNDSEYVVTDLVMNVDWSNLTNNQFAAETRLENDFITLLPLKNMRQEPMQADTVLQDSRVVPVSYAYDDNQHTSSLIGSGLYTNCDSDSLYTDSNCFGSSQLYSSGSVFSDGQVLTVNKSELFDYRDRECEVNHGNCEMPETELRQNGPRSVSSSSSYLNSSISSSMDSESLSSQDQDFVREELWRDPAQELSRSGDCSQTSSTTLLEEPTSLSPLQTNYDNFFHQDWSTNSCFAWKSHQDAAKKVLVKNHPYIDIHNERKKIPCSKGTATRQLDPYEHIKNEMYNMYVLNAENREELDDRCTNLKTSLDTAVVTIAKKSPRKRARTEVVWGTEERSTPQARQCCGPENHICDQMKRIVARTRYFFHLFAKEFKSRNSMAPFRDPDHLTAHVTGISLSVIRECTYPLNNEVSFKNGAGTTRSRVHSCEANGSSSKKRMSRFVQTEAAVAIEESVVNRKRKDVSVDCSVATSGSVQTIQRSDTCKEPAERDVFVVVKKSTCVDVSSQGVRWSPRIQKQQKVFYGTAPIRYVNKVKQECSKQGGEVVKEDCEQQSASSSPRRTSGRSRCPRRAFSPSHRSENGIALVPVCRLKFIRKGKARRFPLEDVNIELKIPKTSVEEKTQLVFPRRDHRTISPETCRNRKKKHRVKSIVVLRVPVDVR